MILAPLPADAPVGLYVHIPFCAHICPYCDFNTYAGKSPLIPRYVDALCRDVHTAGQRHGSRAAATIFFGGGTPSLLSPADIGRVIDACRAAFLLAADAEISLEANPNGLTVAYLAGLRAVGVNRLSIGVQTTQRRGLRVLGRQHEAADGEAALVAARQAGFEDVSLDLIFGWPEQTPEGWRADLDTVLGWAGDGPDHLSLYSLIVEPGTPFADAVHRGIWQVPDDDAAADLYEAAIALLAAAGWDHYEVANWAKRPDRFSRHNALYWQHGDYLAFGAGAHGHLAGTRTMNHLLPETYIAAVTADDTPVSNSETLDAATQRGETMMLGLRLLHDGVDAGAFAARHGVELDQVYGSTIDELTELGLLQRTGHGVRLTQRGLMLANDVAARFF